MMAPHPLDRPLPHDVAAGESAFIQFYQKYAVFSWPWAWRRTLLFGSIGVLAGVSFGVSHGLFVQDFWQGVIVSLSCAAANVVLVGAGPAIAALFRHGTVRPRACSERSSSPPWSAARFSARHPVNGRRGFTIARWPRTVTSGQSRTCRSRIRTRSCGARST